MTARTTSAEATEYLDRVRAMLADLPAEEREELLDELATHLAEVADETEAPLAASLGTPEEYAAELRASAGLAPADGAGPRRRRIDLVRQRYDTIRESVAGSPNLRGLFDFLGQLRPAWWIARGFLIAVLCWVILADTGFQGLLPTSGLIVVFVPFALLVIGASVWLGRRTTGLPAWPRRLVVGAGLVLAALGYFCWAFTPLYASSDPPAQSVSVAPGPLENVSDIQVYDSEGRPLYNVRLFDQDGNPIELPSPCGLGPRYAADGTEVRNVYPSITKLPDGTMCYQASRPAAERIPKLRPPGAPEPSSGETGPTPDATPPTPRETGTSPTPGAR